METLIENDEAYRELLDSSTQVFQSDHLILATQR